MSKIAFYIGLVICDHVPIPTIITACVLLLCCGICNHSHCRRSNVMCVCTCIGFIPKLVHVKPILEYQYGSKNFVLIGVFIALVQDTFCPFPSHPLKQQTRWSRTRYLPCIPFFHTCELISTNNVLFYTTYVQVGRYSIVIQFTSLDFDPRSRCDEHSQKPHQNAHVDLSVGLRIKSSRNFPCES